MLFILLPFALADEAEDIIYANKLKTHLTISSSFDIIKTKPSYQIEYVTVKLSYLPLASYRQEIVSHITSPKSVEEGDYLSFNWNNPSIGNEEFSSEYIVLTESKFFPVTKEVSFPIINLDKEFIQYMNPTKLIDINEDIRKLANDIRGSNDDLYSIVFDAAIWVNENIDYDLSTATAEASLSSSWVLENRRGVCDEMTNLFISLLRSLGIPAKFVSGISYTNSEQFTEPWGPHGWAEVYFPEFGWVPFDPTYGQYGFVDASHIKLKESIDSDKSSIDYEWLSSGVDIQGNIPDNDIEVLEKYGKTSSGLSFELDTLKDEVGFGSYAVVSAEISNLFNEYRTFKVELVGTKETGIEDQVKYVILKPKKTKEIAWKIRFPTNLNKDSIYTFPFNAYDNYGNSYETSIFVSQKFIIMDEEMVDLYIESLNENEMLLDVKLDCVSKSSIMVGEKNNISCSTEDLEGLTACLDDECKPVKGDFYFERSYESAGAYPLLILLKKGELTKSYFTQLLVLDNPQVDVSWGEYSDTLLFSESTRISFEIERTSLSKPSNMEVIIEYNGQSSSNRVDDFEDSKIIQLILEGSDLNIGKNDIKLLVTYEDNTGNKFSQEFSTSINMKTSNFWEYLMSKLNSFSIFLYNLM